MKNIINEKIAEQIHKKYFKLIYHKIDNNELTAEKEFDEYVLSEPKNRDIAYWKDKENFNNYLILSPKKLYLLRIHKPRKEEDKIEIQLYELTGE